MTNVKDHLTLVKSPMPPASEGALDAAMRLTELAQEGKIVNFGIVIETRDGETGTIVNYQDRVKFLGLLAELQYTAFTASED